MKRFRVHAFVVLVLLISAVAAWLWWFRFERVEMTGYVPADSIIYFEVNSLPEVINSFAETNAWKQLAPPAGLDFGVIGNKQLTRLVARTGIGPAEAVVLARSQIAVTILGVDAVEDDSTRTIKPRLAIIIESHTGEARVRRTVEKIAGDFARRLYAQPRLEQHTTNAESIDAESFDAVHWSTWSAPPTGNNSSSSNSSSSSNNSGGGARQIIAAVSGSVAVIGNDQATIEACLATRRGERPALSGAANLNLLRGRVEQANDLMFGYMPPAGAAKLLQVAATAYAEQISADPRAQSAAAILLPQFASRVLGGAVWSARTNNGEFEDRLFFAVQEGVIQSLQGTLRPAAASSSAVSELLPRETYQLTRYNYQDAQAAWLGLKTAATSPLDKLTAPIFARFLDATLKPYGIEAPARFLGAAGPEITTARLSNLPSSTILIAAVRDREVLRAQVRERLGANPRIERIGDAEMLVATNPERGAASFVANYLLMGQAANVRRCLEARRTQQTLSTVDAFKQAASTTGEKDLTGVVTYTDDEVSTRAVISALSAQSFLRKRPPDAAALERAFAAQQFATTVTSFVEGGFQRTVRSSFGQFGNSAMQLLNANDD